MMLKEHDFIQHLRNLLSADLRHDAFFDEESRLVLTQDMLIEKTHFNLATTSPEDLGWKAIAVNLSDLAATAAQPLWLTVGLACPVSTESDWIKRLYTGMQACCDAYGAQIVGGDTTRGDTICISVSATGKVPQHQAVGRRTGAEAGHVIVIAGWHGLSALGLHALTHNLAENYPEAVSQHRQPKPMLSLANKLACAVTTNEITMMDTSDGIADALMQLSKINSLDFCVDAQLIPIHNEMQAYTKGEYNKALDLLLYGGEDYGLCLSLPETIARQYPELTIIGQVNHSEVRPTASIQLNGINIPLDNTKTFQHF